MDADSGRQDQNVRKILRPVTIQETVFLISFRECQLFKNLDMKTPIKSKIKLTRHCNYLHIFPIKQERALKSRETIPLSL
jgi:hypothetical protein